MHVDDFISATLNYADGRWPPQADGSLQTHVIRRKKADDEGPDDVQTSYRAELVPFSLKVAPDPESGKLTALFDLTRFSSWAKIAAEWRARRFFPLRIGTSIKFQLMIQRFPVEVNKRYRGMGVVSRRQITLLIDVDEDIRAS